MFSSSTGCWHTEYEKFHLSHVVNRVFVVLFTRVCNMKYDVV